MMILQEFAFLLIILSTATIQADDSVCNTSVCHALSKQLRSYMNLSVDPCEDFYEYACGNFAKLHAQNMSAFELRMGDVFDEIDLAIREIGAKSELESIQFLRNMYQQCNQTDSREAKPLLESISTTLGGWPLLGINVNVTGHWWQYWAEIAIQYGMTPFLSLQSLPYTRTEKVFFIGSGTGGMSQVTFVMEEYRELVKAYRKYIRGVALMFGAKDDQNLSISIERMIELETKLAVADQHSSLYSTYNFTLLKLNQQFQGGIDWIFVLNEIKTKLNSPRNNFTTLDYVPIVNLDRAVQTVKILSETNPTDVLNLFTWLVVQQFGLLTGEKFHAIEQEFQKIATQEAIFSNQNPKVCMGFAVSSLPHLVARVYLDKFFTEPVEKEAKLLVEDLRAQLKHLLETADWLDSPTRAKAVEKLGAMRAHFGGPKWLRNDTILEDMHNFTKDVKLVSNQFLKSLFHLQRVELREILNTDPMRHVPEEWPNLVTPISIEAMNNYFTNDIYVPAAFFRPIFFDINRPYVMNYGGLGAIVGHEFTHGFDNTGRQFGKDGQPNNWWTNKTVAEFNHKSQCFVKQYDAIYDPYAKFQLNGTRTLPENIADNGGVKEGFYAFHARQKRENRLNQLLPELKLNSEQLYFVAWANNYCRNYSPGHIRFIYIPETHSPFKYRVNVPFTNMPEFAQSFHCPTGSKMNPAHKCAVW